MVQSSAQPSLDAQVPGLTLTRFNEGVYLVHDAQGLHVGNLKWIPPQWKFKAIGHDEGGAVIPGGGPLTDKHNMPFPGADAAQVSAGLLGV